MKPHLNKYLLLLSLLFCFNANAFELVVSVTNETCPGNGNLEFAVTGQAPNALITYYVYLLPNTTAPVITTNDSNINVQVAGNYLVVASQLVNGLITSDQASVTVISSYISPQISLVGESIVCGNDGKITANTISGTNVSYQILSGPITTNYQSSNVFLGLPQGSYVIRALDTCGNTSIGSITLSSVSLSISITEGSVASTTITDCGYVDVMHTINGTLSPNYFPITIQATFQLPNGGASITTQTITSGNEFTVEVPVNTQNESLNYSLQIITACGSQFLDSNNFILAPYSANVIVKESTCNELEAEFTILNGKPPFTINYINFPAGFNPLASNSNHPGPYFSDLIIYNAIHEGNYSAQITDACGNEITVGFFAEIEEQIIAVIANAQGCSGLGDFCASTSNPSVNISNAVLLSGPTGFTYPYNVSSFINGEEICMDGITVGTYTIQITDVCGDTIEKEINFTSSEPEVPLIGQRASCALGEAGVVITFTNSEITNVEIVEAPSSFLFALPYDVSSNIASNGNFYMNSLPNGTYKFKVVSNCGYDNFVSITLNGYILTSTEIDEPIEICGGFNLYFNHISNGVFGDNFYLQKYNLSTNTWEHPITGVDYDPNIDIPSNTNSLLIQNAITNLNIAGNSGLYRILKVFFTLDNGSASSFRCVSEIGQFVFEGGPKFIDAYVFPCVNNLQEVVIIAEGLEPLQYRITEKNGLPFLVNNGTQNNFSNLSPGLYKFEFEDICGFVRGRLVDITLLATPTINQENLCPNQDGFLQVQGISFINYKWFKQNNPSLVLSTSNVLSFPNFNPSTDAGIYSVILTSTNSNSCINQMIQYEIKASDYIPNAGSDVNQSYCSVAQTIDLGLLLSNPHDVNGIWSDATGNILGSSIVSVSNLGTYVYTYTVSSVLCSITDTSEITISLTNTPQAPVILAPTTICKGNNVQLSVGNYSNATYSWSGPNGFSSNAPEPIVVNFSELNDGLYSLVLVANGCNYPSSQVVLSSNKKPDFTINGLTEICQGQQETLSIVAQNFSLTEPLYQWYYNGQVNANQTQSAIEVNQFGKYEVEVDIAGCITRKGIIVSEKQNAFDIELTQGCSGSGYTITVLNSEDFPNATYTWLGPNSFSSSNQNIIISNNLTGNYTLLVENEEGCIGMQSINVANIPCQIPNLVSPNSDNQNDTFDLTGLDVKMLKIFNRYGRIVYQKNNYLNEWVGQNENGNLLPDSTYFYIIEYNSEEKKQQTGWILLTH